MSIRLVNRGPETKYWDIISWTKFDNDLKPYPMSIYLININEKETFPLTDFILQNNNYSWYQYQLFF